MRSISFLPFLLFSSVLSFAQQNSIKAGGGTGSVPYEGVFGWNIELQYERELAAEEITIFAALGANAARSDIWGQSRGSDGVTSWNNSWAYAHKERFHYLDIGMKLRLFERGSRYEFKLGAGAALGYSVFKYPETIFIRRGIIEQREDTVHRVGVVMPMLGIDNKIKVTDQIFVSLSLNLRVSFEEQHILERVILYENGRSSSTSGISAMMNAALQVGHVF